MTVLGTLPIDWEVSNIQDCFQKNEKIKIGPFGSQLKKEYLLPRGDYYVYGQENVYQDDFHICYRFLSFQRFNSLKSCEIRPGDFVISTMGTIGKCAVVPDYAHIGIMDSHLVRMRFNDSIYKPFFAYLFRSRIIQYQIRKLSVGGIMEGLSTSILKKIDVIVPPIQEQKRIASALSTIDSLICALGDAIAKKQQIKSGLMQLLLTGKTRLPGFNEEWRSCKLKDIAEMYSGGTPSSKEPKFSGGDIPFLSSSGKFIYTTEKTITKMGLENSSARVFPAGTLMYAMYASLGKCSVSQIDTAISQAILGFILSDEIDKMYLYYHFCFIEEQVKNMGQTGTQSNLSKALVEQFIIPVPIFSEQRAIADVLSTIDDEIYEIELKREKYLSIKQGMMQELLTGKTRL